MLDLAFHLGHSRKKALIFNMKPSFYATDGTNKMQANMYTHCNQAVTLESCIQQCCGHSPNLRLASYMKSEHLSMFWVPVECYSSGPHMATSRLGT